MWLLPDFREPWTCECVELTEVLTCEFLRWSLCDVTVDLCTTSEEFALLTWSNARRRWSHDLNMRANEQKWACASTEEIIASISLFVLQKKCTIQQSYDIQTAKQEHFHLNQETGTWQQQPANLHTPTFDPHQEETHVLHSSDVMEVRHFTKVLLGISSSRLGKQERGSEDERPTRFWHHALQTLK